MRHGIALDLTQAALLGGASLWAPLAHNAAMAVIGDSINADGDTPSGASNVFNLSVGVHNHAMALARGPARIPIGANKATVGQNTSQIAARFTTDLSPFAPKLIIADGGRNNDHNPILASAAVADFASMLSQARAMGSRLIILPPLPWTGMSTDDQTWMASVDAGLAALAAPDCKIIDKTGWNPATMTQDGTHPNDGGAFFMGAKFATPLSQMFASGDILFTSGSDPANGMGTLGFLPGTGGAKSGAATGTVADNWTVGGNATSVASVFANPKGGQWQQVVISALNAGDCQITGIGSSFSFATNDIVEAFCEFEVDAGASSITGIWADNIWVDGGNTECFYLFPGLTDFIAPPGAYKGVLRSNAMKLIGAATVFAFIVHVNLIGTARIGRVGMRKAS